MTWHWIGPAFFSLTLIPARVAMVTDHTPKPPRPRRAPTPPRGRAILAPYAATPLAIPRLAGASPAITSAATAEHIVATTRCAVAAITSHCTVSTAS
ncbi:hypothetical protein [Streptomyces sp. DH24]|uniref:hypothetical protein n=1 Tax=Streptomyces sp. DH24 TaxID=3040123 RepID=UPI00244260B2|nr:hypothetical protein [Streptomyces sp. DH24]MDG9720685.1 hypothetical protein [Streptomyces sp. DH24]